MRGLGSGIAAVALVCALAAPGVATGAERGEVGGPPSDTTASLPKGKKKAKRFGLPVARSEAIVIGVGESVAGGVELVAQDSSAGICLSTQYQNEGFVVGSCMGSATPRGAIEGTAWTIDRISGAGYSSVTGLVTPGASVYVAFEGKRGRRLQPATVATPDASILARLHTTPFSYFHAAASGCTPSHKTIAIASDASGTELGRERGQRFPKKFASCKSVEESSAVTIFTRRAKAILF